MTRFRLGDHFGSPRRGSQVSPLARHFLVDALAVGANRYLDGSCLGTQTLPHRPPPGGRSHAIQRYGPWIRSAQNDRRRHHRHEPATPWSPDAPAPTCRHLGPGCAAVRHHQRTSRKSHGALLPRISTIRLHSIIDSRRYPRTTWLRNPHTSTHPCRASRHPATYNATYNAAHDATPTPHTAPHTLPHTPTRQQCTLGSTKHTTSGRL